MTQFLFYLYHNVHEFMPVFMGSNVLTALAGTLFPMVNSGGGLDTTHSSPAGSPARDTDTPVVINLPPQVSTQ